ncbi:MAG: EpsG family protein [Oscillospiraceae bacterium]|nr:EpsG family protein [Oscillospiraceae bacterium]
MIIVSALRNYTVGRDLQSHYYRTFQNIINMPWNNFSASSYDPGYVVFYKLIGLVTDNPQWMIAIHALFVIGVSGWFIYKNSDDVVLSTFMFVTTNTWFMYMTMMRQAMAICFTLIALEIWKKSNWKVWRYVLFVVVILLATSFHSSALLALAYPLFNIIKFKRMEILLSIVIAVAAVIFYQRIYLVFAGIISLRRDFAEFYSSSGSAINIISLYGVTINAVIFLLGCYVLAYKKRKITDNKDNSNGIGDEESFSDSFLLFMGLLMLICKLTGLRVNIMSRMAYYVGPFMWLLFPRVLKRTSLKSNKQIIKYGMCFIMLVAFIWMGYKSAATLYGTVPYEIFWR